MQTSQLLIKPPSNVQNKTSPGITGVIMRRMELFKLLPREIWDAQWVTTRDHRIRVVRKEAVLKVLWEYPLVICLQIKKIHIYVA